MSGEIGVESFGGSDFFVCLKKMGLHLFSELKGGSHDFIFFFHELYYIMIKIMLHDAKYQLPRCPESGWCKLSLVNSLDRSHALDLD